MRGEALLVPLAALLVAAASWDVVRRKVPNAFPVAVLVAGLMAQAATGGLGAAGFALLAALGLGALLTLAWSARLIGGGDVKLAVGPGIDEHKPLFTLFVTRSEPAAAAAAAVGWPRLPLYLLATALAGGLVALACHAASAPEARARTRASLALAARGVATSSPASASGKVPVPYAAAMAAGALTALLWGR